MCKESKDKWGKRKVFLNGDNAIEYGMCKESKKKLGKERKLILNTHRALNL